VKPANTVPASRTAVRGFIWSPPLVAARSGLINVTRVKQGPCQSKQVNINKKLTPKS
jgi:hypothetical protein